MIDLHSHLIPGVDDGASSLDEAVAALEVMARAGVRAIVTTPHLDGSLTRMPEALRERLAEIDAAWERLVEASAAVGDLRLERGVELMFDAPDPDLGDPRLRLAGTSFVLVEFAGFTVPTGITEALSRLVDRGYHPVVAHPERYPSVQRHPARTSEWLEAGCYLQVNAGSLLGRYGPEAKRASLALLETGAVSYLSSDYHARGRLRLTGSRELLQRMDATEQAELLFSGNAERLLRDEPPLPVPPVSTGWWRRVLSRFG